MSARFLRWTTLAAAIFLVGGCGDKPQSDGSQTVRIGQVSPLTGPQAHLGRDNDNGARLALDEINARGLTIGGKKISLPNSSRSES